jgi:hypothetical protein
MKSLDAACMESSRAALHGPSLWTQEVSESEKQEILSDLSGDRAREYLSAYFDRLDRTYEAAFAPLLDLLNKLETAYHQTARDAPPPAAPPIEQYVTLDQMAAVVSRSKRTLEKRKNRRENPLPAPYVEGGGGKPDEWLWALVRPWLEREFSRKLPERFPQQRPPR